MKARVPLEIILGHAQKHVSSVPDLVPWLLIAVFLVWWCFLTDDSHGTAP